MKQAKTLTDKELKLVLAHCAARRHAERDRAIVMVSFLSGLRAKEIAALKLSDVRAADGSLRTEFVLSAAQTKGGQTRRVFVSTRLQRELGAYLQAVKLRSCCDALFQSQKNAALES